LDELLDGLVLWFDYWEGMSAIAKANGGVHKYAAIRAFFYRSYSFAWLLWIVEDIAPVARR
jgi:hypothetical protein